jgi:hypothetical protein
MRKVEEVVGLEPTHVGFAIRGITSFAIPPTEMYSLFLNHLKLKKLDDLFMNNGRGQGIRTLGGFHLAGFQNRYDRPTLSTLYIIMVRMIGIEPILRNRNWILSPTRLPVPPHSHTVSQFEVCST